MRVFMLLLLASCGDSREEEDEAACDEACDRLYGEGECNIQRPGQTAAEMHDRCMDECTAAMEEDGEVGEYDPYAYTPADVAVELENRAQAELWMECVAATDCELLEGGFCAPVW